MARNMSANQKCSGSFKKMSILSFNNTILLRCLRTSRLMDNFMLLEVRAVTDGNPIIAPVEATKRQFTYCEILQITNNLKRILGEGGFGTVYHGCIDKTQVAVNMLSPSSVQGLQQFHSEALSTPALGKVDFKSRLSYSKDHPSMKMEC
ncbi:hypothetical protein L3X38_036187 [Prunus dulcis]|uniref:Uncharacterized protein n=1 Tax=Prunus dulcis TaxID=3755 RepID=A0AAD4YPD8_PRUDU|nr:hypothetical protein L3X38_036187 [Prunus dulcis]